MTAPEADAARIDVLAQRYERGLLDADDLLRWALLGDGSAALLLRIVGAEPQIRALDAWARPHGGE